MGRKKAQDPEELDPIEIIDEDLIDDAEEDSDDEVVLLPDETPSNYLFAVKENEDGDTFYFCPQEVWDIKGKLDIDTDLKLNFLLNNGFEHLEGCVYSYEGNSRDAVKKLFKLGLDKEEDLISDLLIEDDELSSYCNDFDEDEVIDED